MRALLERKRTEFLRRINRDIVRWNVSGKHKHGPCPNFCDKDSKKSVLLGCSLAEMLPGGPASGQDVKGQRAGSLFEIFVKEFLETTFPELDVLRPGKWMFWQKKGDNGKDNPAGNVASFEQYSHLSELEKFAKAHELIGDVLGYDYIVHPDVVIARMPEEDETINSEKVVVDDSTALWTPLRKKNNELPILHATVSCKWTMRSDRSQNSRTEALNLIRNRKGPLPHIVIVTMEPLPSRIASIAIGTGDIDCVYHAALYELLESAQNLYKRGELDLDDLQQLENMCRGKRLRDISDLPMDLAI